MYLREPANKGMHRVAILLALYSSRWW